MIALGGPDGLPDQEHIRRPVTPGSVWWPDPRREAAREAAEAQAAQRAALAAAAERSRRWGEVAMWGALLAAYVGALLILRGAGPEGVARHLPAAGGVAAVAWFGLMVYGVCTGRAWVLLMSAATLGFCRLNH